MSLSRHLFFRMVLVGAGLPGTSQNARALVAQAQAEGRGDGSGPHFNPLNTTREMGAGERAFNDLGGGLHVWSYPSVAIGVSATIKTLLQANFAHLHEQLARGDSATRYWQLLLEPPRGMAQWGTGTPGAMTVAAWLADVDRHWYDYALAPIDGS